MSDTPPPSWHFDRHLRHDELTAWLHDLAARHPQLVSIDTYGTSWEGRPLLLATVTDSTTGHHHAKPAHWVDASIHATELTATVAACVLLQRLVEGHAAGDDTITRALRTRTFYVVPRVNPDGAEAALADSPVLRRSSMRPWPNERQDHLPGLRVCDIDGNGRVLEMRIVDPHGGWMPHPDDDRLMVPVPVDGGAAGTTRYRLLREGEVIDHDGFTVPTPRPREGLDLNRNFPAGWATSVTGSGDHPLSEPEIDALVRAIAARPNICGSHAYHTSGGVLLRPSSTKADTTLPPFDVWVWNQLGDDHSDRTGYPVHSVFEDFTWDPSETMSGAADDWAYEHLGIFSWTTEFWDVVHAATGTKQSTKFWYTGPTDAEALAVLSWVDEHHPDGFVAWAPFEHPQLGAIEIGGFDSMTVWSNPPDHLLLAEVEPHVGVVVHQALAAPCLDIVQASATRIGDDPDDPSQSTWRIEAGVANTGWLPTDVSGWARTNNLTPPVEARITVDDGRVVGSPSRIELGRLDGRSALRFRNRTDGTPDRAMAAWTVRAPEGAVVSIEVSHRRAGTASVAIRCEP